MKKIRFFTPFQSLVAPMGLLLAGVASLSLFLSRTTPAADFPTDQLRTHDPSRILKCNGKYFVFYTGNKLPMRYSADLIHWQRGKPVLEQVPEWMHQAVPAAKGDFVWAPDAIFLNNRYYLYYSYSTFGSRTSAIGLLTSPTLDPESPNYKWNDEGLVIATGQSSHFNAIDPAPILDAQGQLWLTLGSWNNGGIQLVKADNSTGQPISAPITLAAGQATGPEAPYLHYHDGYYYLFENEGLCCKAMNSTYRIMMGRSRSVTGPYLDKEGKSLSRGGGSEFMGSDGVEIGPGHVGIFQEGGIDRLTFHFYNSLASGAANMGMRTLVWSEDGWPQAGTELQPGRYAITSPLSEMALGVFNNRSENGTLIDQATYRGGPTQQWNLSPVGDGFFSIGSLGTGKYLDLAEPNSKDGTKVTQNDWTGKVSQQWRIEATGQQTYRIISKGGGTAVTLPGNSKLPQAQVQGFAWSGTPGQQWIFKRLP